MEKVNTRNDSGVKDAQYSYRKGNWEQYTDFAGTTEPNVMAEAHDMATAKVFIKEVAQVANPDKEFKAVKIYPEGFYRIYYR